MTTKTVTGSARLFVSACRNDFDFSDDFLLSSTPNGRKVNEELLKVLNAFKAGRRIEISMTFTGEERRVKNDVENPNAYMYKDT